MRGSISGLFYIMNHNNKNLSFEIREIQRTDLDEVYQMLLDLIKHDNLEDKFKISKKLLVDYLFDKNPDWFCLVAQDLTDNNLKGFLIYTISTINRSFHKTAALYIDHLYLKPEYRNHNVGGKMIDTLKYKAKNQKIERLEVWCMSYNQIGNRFYQKMGAEKIDRINMYRFNL